MARFFSYKKLIAFAIVAFASLKDVSFLGGCPYALAAATTTGTGATGTTGTTVNGVTGEGAQNNAAGAGDAPSGENNKTNLTGGSNGQKPTGQDPQKPNAGNGFAATSVIGAATIGLLTLAFN
ncbi:hypothetical protein BdWA1_003372 [Babesia duncani]|uniref:Uncharacterized protein n=1 Tax=Babesia duncani TaxID=323732 RepID=A0AAD9UMU3_9APIC|nr:hypothetical protein BdWA1_003372 [Babesia duncani]